MHIPDEIRRCVAFVCYRSRSTNDMKLAGTAFLVSVPITGSGASFIYLITAKHIIDAIQTGSADQKVYLRMNLKSGGAAFVEVPMDRWAFHPEESNVDVAALNWAPPREKFDCLTLPIKYAVTEDVIKKESIGPGDDVFLVGLFSDHFGSKRNLPIVRVGNIASMPEEKVSTDYGDIDAYLVEARSIGGLSGSPVFVYIGGVRTTRSTEFRKGGLPLLYWLGLMHGHYDLSELGIDDLREDSLTKVRINMGIAIVVPTWKILEVINQEMFMKARGKDIEKAAKDAGR